ncbi:MAG TPA: hypothetical protein DCE07_05565 [Peptococcaceae bacterium]|nr:hypothetical protein [Peptococcaceae bacterium]
MRQVFGPDHLASQCLGTALNSDLFCSTQHLFEDRKSDVLILHIIYEEPPRKPTLLRVGGGHQVISVAEMEPE